MQPTFSLLRRIGLGAVLAVIPLTVRAQNESSTDWNHFGLEFRMGFNIKAKFMESGLSTAPAGPSAGGAVNRRYNDGFVNVDSSGNAGGQTWNWGYQHPSQVSGDSLLMHATTLSSATGQSRNDDPIPGFEFNYVRDLGHEKWGRWGIKAAFGYTEMNLRDTDPLSASGRLITDTYQLHGVSPPMAPYAGSFNGPGTVIGSSPTRSVAPDTAAIAGTRSMDATLFDFRLGPSVDLNIVKNLAIELSGGLAVGVVDSSFAFTETGSSGSTRDAGCQAGAYAEAGLSYRVCPTAALFAGGQFQYLGDFNQSLGGHSARLDLSQSVFCVLGLRFHF